MSGIPQFRLLLPVICAALVCNTAVADEFILSVGGGPQPGSDQTNKTVGIDYSFARHIRSPRQHILFGVSYTYIGTDTMTYDNMYAISIYPQLSFYPRETSKVYSIMPDWAEPFFYVRALAPSYISANRLGDRQQANNFSFQAQIGVGVTIKRSNDTEAIVALSWKHFSNARLFDDNDGIDLPLVLNFGIKF